MDRRIPLRERCVGVLALVTLAGCTAPRLSSHLAHDAGIAGVPTVAGDGSEAPDAGAVCTTATVSGPTIVNTSAGALRGALEDGTLIFRGIPYAEPPTGDRRFRPPEDKTCWSGVRDALEFGHDCPQIPLLGDGEVEGDEDCLVLNVWAPAAPRPDGKLRPVMFFIHGGGNFFGSSDMVLAQVNLYDGKALSKQDVVVVTINYRIGALGFLAHPDLMGEAGGAGGTNWGHLDQLAALRWVQANIAAFGGDAAQVTVFGESAGGMAVCALLASPLAKGLFSAAIMESGGCTASTPAQRLPLASRIVAEVGCTGAADVPACLRQVPASAYVKAVTLLENLNHFGYGLDLAFEAIIDGHLLTEPPLDSIAAGRFNKVPFMIGSNTDEFELFALMIPQSLFSSCSAYTSLIRGELGSAADMLLAAYPCTRDQDAHAAFVALATDGLFTCPAREIARVMVKQVPTYRYLFSYVRADPFFKALRAFHSSELAFVFGSYVHPSYTPPASEDALGDQMQRYWARFAEAHDPNGPKSPNDPSGAAGAGRGMTASSTVSWPAYDPAADDALRLDVPLSRTNGVRTANCDLWDKLSR